jgi:hypothetical protein
VPLAGDGHAVPVVLHADAVDEAVVGDGDAADPGVAAVVPLVSPAAAPWANLHELLGHNHPPLRLLLLKKICSLVVFRSLNIGTKGCAGKV